ncbi:SDR family NAD(P)-dependent oxidoreductase [Kineococcus sp. GCM10028916]|uniref:SDR family NAD(P)-dependent oxidoreductase n=1 Tax=Kineococcus sp. GCM10028916 TaxID=3273394 RepID=UPI00362AD31B
MTGTGSGEEVGRRQRPLGSGFDAASTIDDVLRGIDLSGQNVIVTAGHTGLGAVLTRALAAAGASVTVGARDPQRAAAALPGVERVQVDRLDLLDPASVASFAQRWNDSGRPLHVLVNNAGLPAPAERVQDDRGHEAQFATNYLGHFQLTLALHPALRAARGARVVNVTSGAHRFSGIRWDDVHATAGYDPGVAYAQSKTALVLLAVGLDRRWAAEGIRGYAVHPGVVVGTDLNAAVGDDALRVMGLIDGAGRPVIDPVVGKKTPEQGASTIAFAATSPMLHDVGGVYLKDNDVSAVNDQPLPVTADSIPSEVASHAIDPRAADRLWKLGEELLRPPSRRSARPR